MSDKYFENNKNLHVYENLLKAKSKEIGDWRENYENRFLYAG